MSRIEGSGGLGRMPVSKRSGNSGWPWSDHRQRLRERKAEARRNAKATRKWHRTKPVSATSPPPTPSLDGGDAER